MKQNKNESILCIGEILVFIASLFLLFNRGSLGNVMRISIAGAISILFILLSDSIKSIYQSKKVAKLSWLFGIILILCVYYAVGSLNMFGPYFSLEGSYSGVFKASIAILAVVLSYLSMLKQHSKVYLYTTYASMLILIYYAGLAISLNEGYIIVIITTILMLINIVKKEGDLLFFSKALSYIFFFYAIYYLKDLEPIPLSLLCLTNLLNILIVGYKDKEYSSDKIYLFLLIIMLYKLANIILIFDYKVFLIGAITFSEFIYNYLNKNQNKYYDILIKITYNIFYIYVLFHLPLTNIVVTASTCAMILVSSIGSCILRNNNKRELVILPIKLVILANILFYSVNINIFNIYPMIIAFIINLVLLIIYKIVKKESIKKELLFLMILNILIPLFNNTLNIIEYLLAIIIVFIDYYMIVIKSNYTGIKKVLINIVYILINLYLINVLDTSNIKYVLFAIIMLVIMANSFDSEFLLLASLIAFLYSGVQYISGLDIGILGYALKECLLLSGLYIFLTYIIKEKKTHTWMIILVDILIIYNLLHDPYHLIPLCVSVGVLIIGILRDKKLYSSVLVLFLISCYSTLLEYKIPGIAYIFILGFGLIIYSFYNKERLIEAKDKLKKEIFEDDEEDTEVPQEVSERVKAMGASYCVNCGNIMAASDIYCRHCGYKKEE